MLSIVPEAAPDLADPSVLLAPRVTRWFETRAIDDAAADRLDKPVVRTPYQALVEALLEQSSADLAWLSWEDGSDSVVIARDRMSPLQPSSIGEFPERPRGPPRGRSRAGLAEPYPPSSCRSGSGTPSWARSAWPVARSEPLTMPTVSVSSWARR